jgi:hypothetical protein
MTNFFCLKWDTKYNSNYVNRLFKSLCKHYKNNFNFYCLTDDGDGLHKDIIVEKLPTKFSKYPRTRIFTSEKMCYFNDYKHLSGKKAWFDLDILVQNDITNLIDRDKEKPCFIMNYWRDPFSHIKNYSFMTTPLNSSFVAWQDDVGYDLYEDLVRNEEKAFFTYPSFDKYLFYQCYRKKMIDTWEKGIVYNYNIGAQYPDDLVPKKYHSDYKICLFNTSHKAWARPNETQIELHEANGWAKEMWMSYDSI